MKGEKCEVRHGQAEGSRIPRYLSRCDLLTCVASLVRITSFAAAPSSVSQAHTRATSRGFTRFSGRRVYPLPIT